MAAPLSPGQLLNTVCQHDIDTVIQINQTRDLDIALPAHVRHISWMHDQFPTLQHNFSSRFFDSDILYILGSIELNVDSLPNCLVNTLFTGVNTHTLKRTAEWQRQNIDISMCAGLPPYVPLSKNIKSEILHLLNRVCTHMPLVGSADLLRGVLRLLLGREHRAHNHSYTETMEIINIIESSYRPLRGELSTQKLKDALLSRSTGIKRMQKLANKRTLLFTQQREKRTKETLASIQNTISYYSQSYPRVMDRKLLIHLASQVTDSLALYGNYLGAYPFAQRYYKGAIHDQDTLLNVYRDSKINLHNQGYGLGLHSRVLECMAVGGFIFTHSSPHDHEAGGMLTHFEPEVHFGLYTPETFIDEARRWLHDDKNRIQAGINAKKIVRSSHCWHHRAKQILEDLKQ